MDKYERGKFDYLLKYMDKNNYNENPNVKNNELCIDQRVTEKGINTQRSTGLHGRIALKLALMFLALPMLAMSVFGLIIIAVNTGVITSGSPFGSNQAIVNLIQIVCYPALIAIWFRPTVQINLRIKTLATAIAVGLLWWIFISPVGIMPSGIAIIFVCCLLRDPSFAEGIFRLSRSTIGNDRGFVSIDDKSQLNGLMQQGNSVKERTWTKDIFSLIAGGFFTIVALGTVFMKVQGGGPLGALIYSGISFLFVKNWWKENNRMYKN
jgi:hypothetical protein